MKISILRILPAALALAFASAGLSAMAQTTSTEPSVADKAVDTGKAAVNATERGAKKAWSATKKTTKKAANATKRGAKKAVNATENAGHAAADGMRTTGDKIGEKIPGTAQNEAAKKP